MRMVSLIVLAAMIFSGCVTTTTNRRDVLQAYRKGLKVGRVIGRDEILGKLKSPDCFTQTVGELMDDKEGKNQ